MDAVLYIHGQGGSASESLRYAALFSKSRVIGLDYRASTPWEAGKEIHDAVSELKRTYGRVTVIANSIGAFFCMHADIGSMIQKAFFISPVIDMERLIAGMMERENVTERELESQGAIRTSRGETLSWEYLEYVRSHPLRWEAPTSILYGARDELTSCDTVRLFAESHNAEITVMESAGHWFHTDEEMRFIDAWMTGHGTAPGT